MSGIEPFILEMWAVSLAMAVGSSFDHRHPFSKSKFRTETINSRVTPRHNLLFSCSSGAEADAEDEALQYMKESEAEYREDSRLSKAQKSWKQTALKNVFLAYEA
jgi:hypothetical protein